MKKEREPMFQTSRRAAAILLVALSVASSLAATEEGEEGFSFDPKLTFISYFDNRDFSTLAAIVSVSDLPGGFSLWGFTDMHGAQQQPDQRWEVRRQFSEYRLSHDAPGTWLGLPGLGFQMEFNSLTGGGDLLRFGLTYKHGFRLPKLAAGWLQWRGFFVETDGSGGQASLIYFLPFHEGVNLSGFADWNVAEGGPDRWVVEPQLNVRIFRRLWAVLEYRHNGFERAARHLDGSGWALGLRLDFQRGH